MRAKHTCLAVFLIFVLGPALYAAAQAAAPGPVKIKVTAEQANLREKPDIGSGIVQQIPEGTVLEADKKEGEWYFVRFTLEDGGVIGGYIHESLVQVIEGAAPPAGAKPAAAAGAAAAKPQEPKPSSFRIEAPDFSTGSVPLEISLSAGVTWVQPHDLNDGARGFVGAHGADLGIPAPRPPDDFRLSYLAGFELTYRASPRLAIGLGTDYVSGANTDEVVYSNGVVTESVRTRPAARVVPVKFVVRYYPGSSFYVRGEVGVYAIKASYLYRIDRDGSWDQWEGTATDSAFGAEAAFGGEWKVAAKTAIFVEAGFRYARVEGPSGKGVFTNSLGTDVPEPGLLYLFDKEASDGAVYPRLFVRETVPAEEGVVDVRTAVIDMSGMAVRAGVRFRL
jgi:hypothetical protein